MRLFRNHRRQNVVKTAWWLVPLFFSILPQVLSRRTSMSEQTHANVDPRFLRISASESTRVYVDDSLDGNRPVFLWLVAVFFFCSLFSLTGWCDSNGKIYFRHQYKTWSKGYQGNDSDWFTALFQQVLNSSALIASLCQAFVSKCSVLPTCDSRFHVACLIRSSLILSRGEDNECTQTRSSCHNFHFSEAETWCRLLCIVHMVIWYHKVNFTIS